LLLAVWWEGMAGSISDSYSTATVSGYEGLGGLVGENPYNSSTVSNSYATGSVTGWQFVGGLMGRNSGTVGNSYATGSVDGDLQIGGLVGANNYTISDCYATGSVAGVGKVGGLVGWNYFNSTVERSYSTGSVTGSGEVGGLMGANNGTVTKSPWNTDTSGRATSAGGTGMTTAQMKDFATFSPVGWNIVTVADRGMCNVAYIWNIVDGVTYPFLSWQCCV
jgi:hypothetical protein